MNTPSLVDILAEKTETKINTGAPGSNNTASGSGPNFNPNDFDSGTTFGTGPKPADNKGAFSEFGKPTTEQNVNFSKKNRPKLSPEQYKRQAKQCVGFVNSIQVMSLPYLYQKTMFTKEERKSLKELRGRQKADGTGETVYTEKELELLDKYKMFEEMREKIPYTDAEMDLIMAPLADVFEENDVQLGKLFLLISAISITSGPRFMPLLTPLE